MNFGDKVFVVTPINVLVATIKFPISHQGVVTGYDVSFSKNDNDEVTVPMFTKVPRKDIFVEEIDAKKELFKRKLKKDEEVIVPAEDKKGDRHWISGYKKNRY